MPNTPAPKPITQVLADALNFYMSPYWSNVSLGRAAGLSEGTIRNYRRHTATTGTSGKARSAKLVELEALATAMGLTVSDLVTDLSDEQRTATLRKRAAEHYERTGSLPPWAPDARASPLLPGGARLVAHRHDDKPVAGAHEDEISAEVVRSRPKAKGKNKNERDQD